MTLTTSLATKALRGLKLASGPHSPHLGNASFCPEQASLSSRPLEHYCLSLEHYSALQVDNAYRSSVIRLEFGLLENTLCWPSATQFPSLHFLLIVLHTWDYNGSSTHQSSPIIMHAPRGQEPCPGPRPGQNSGSSTPSLEPKLFKPQLCDLIAMEP